MSEPVGVVLAAGLATRMGGPKQLLPFRDSSVLETVVNAAARSLLKRVVVVLGAYAAEIQDKVDLAAVEVVVNPEPERGNLSSLRTAIGVVGEQPILLIMGDMPGITSELIDAHVTAFSADPAWLVTTTYEDGVGHPFMLSQELVGSLEELGGPKPLWQLTEDERAATLHVEGPMPTDIDTPADYGEALARDATQ